MSSLLFLFDHGLIAGVVTPSFPGCGRDVPEGPTERLLTYQGFGVR